MKRYLFAIVVTVIATSTVAAQPAVPPKLDEPLPPIPPARWMFSSTPGLFYYDSGDYLLGGFQGLSRSKGAWTMQPASDYGAYGPAAYGSRFCRTGTHRFRR
jgi:hypothetical protein